jgi:hypothetical protein
MKHGKSIGIFCGVIGLFSGVYFGVLPNLSYLNSSVVTGHQVGLTSATLATVIGVSLAIMGVIHHYSNKNT